MLKKVIHTHFAPNVMLSDVSLALRGLLCSGKKTAEFLCHKIKNHFDFKDVVLVNSAREGLYYGLKALGLKYGDEIILQPFTCMVVIDALIWNGLIPIYVDIDASSYNINAKLIESKISQKTGAILVQHTFGIPADMKTILTLCKKHNLKLIEDCAHAIGGETYVDGKKRLLGTMGDISVFSFGRSKMISCVSGGALCTRSNEVAQSFDKVRSNLKKVSYFRRVQYIAHIVLSIPIKFLYNVFIGKLLLVVFQKVRLLPMEVTKQEKAGINDDTWGASLCNGLSGVALNQWQSLDAAILRRKKIAKMYFSAFRGSDFECFDPSLYEAAVLLRYPIQAQSKEIRDNVLSNALKEGIVFGDFYLTPIAPIDCDTSKTYYTHCPVTEEVCDRVFNLPLYPSLEDSQVLQIINLVLSSHGSKRDK